LLILGTVALLGTPTVPARANTTFAGLFIGAVTVDSGLGYPIFTLPTSSPNLLSPHAGYTPSQVVAHFYGARQDQDACSALNNGIPDDGFTNCHWTFDHKRDANLGQIACIDTSVNLVKLNKSPVHLGSCSFVRSRL
jgi:hypothetical protein